MYIFLLECQKYEKHLITNLYQAFGLTGKAHKFYVVLINTILEFQKGQKRDFTYFYKLL